jgi:hypothetical protein
MHSCSSPSVHHGPCYSVATAPGFGGNSGAWRTAAAVSPTDPRFTGNFGLSASTATASNLRAKVDGLDWDLR